MNLGINLYSVRNLIKTEEELTKTAVALYNMGYEYLQFSGAPFDAEMIKRVKKKTGVPFVLTHSPIDRIIDDTERLMDEHESFGCRNIGLSTIPWSLICIEDEMKKVDMNPKRPGIQSLNNEDNGQGGLKLAFDPDGKTIYQLPHCRSNTNKVKLSDNFTILAYNITAIGIPDLTLTDPIDAGYKGLLSALKNAAYRPSFSMTFRDFAVGTKHIAVLGSSASNISGLQAGGDITIIDKSQKTPISFNKAADPRRAHEIKYGFKLAQGDPKFENVEQNSHAVMWIP